MTRFLSISLLFLLIACGGERNYVIIHTEKAPQKISVEIVRKHDDMRKGLMFRKTLAPNAGMLFDYRKPRHVTMWMKNTYLSLDMIFIREDGVITRIEKNTTPFSEKTISSGQAVLAVLEVNAGTSDALGIKVGDHIEHNIFRN